MLRGNKEGSKTYNRYRKPAADWVMVTVSRDLYDVLKVYALRNNYTLMEATNKILVKGIQQEYADLTPWKLSAIVHHWNNP